jgi:glycine/D-amino acid oxidase-like deaminating enzyme
VFNCTYSSTNRVLAASSLTTIPLRHELTELALVRVPPPLESRAATVMCGPFFSVMPFPARGLHSLSHVRYTPHGAWLDRGKGSEAPARDVTPATTNVERMRRDAERYLPALHEVTYVESLWEFKTVLPSSDVDDSRPILFRRDPAVPNVISIVGAKIDNIYDVFVELDALRDAGGLR